RVGRGQVELPRPRAAREVAVDGADGHVRRLARDAGTGVDARPARGLDEGRPDLLEEAVVPHLLAVAEDLLRAALDVELHVLRLPHAPLVVLAQDARVHVHVLLLPRRAAPGVG